MVNRHINKDNQPANNVEIEDNSFSKTPCDIATLGQNGNLSYFTVFSQEVNGSLGGFSTCDKVATKSSDKPSLALDLVDGLFAGYGSVAGNTDKAKQVIMTAIKADIKKEAQRQVELLKDDIEAQRLVLQSHIDRLIAVSDLILDKKDKLTLSQGRTPALRGKAGVQRKGFQHGKDYRRAATMLSIDNWHCERSGKHISSRAEAIRVCQQVETILIAQSALDDDPLFDSPESTFQRFIRDGLKHFPG